MSSNITIEAKRGKERITFPVIQTSGEDTKYIIDNGDYYGNAPNPTQAIERYKERYMFWHGNTNKKNYYYKRDNADAKRHCNELDNWVKQHRAKCYNIVVYGD
ncbi:MAG: hypothetical protein M0P71_00895 [Melioribacteraceae bacterium]|nr:hypothetical protein [Melioribacteraceae bacterium]